MILYMILLKLSFPKCVKVFYSILIPLVNLDILPTEYITDKIFNFNIEEEKPYNDPLEELGFETHIIVLNLGSIFVFNFIFTVGLVILLILKYLLPPSQWQFKL